MEIKLLHPIQPYIADCLDFMRDMPSESIDLICTDPAYESMKRWEGIGTTARMGMGKKGSGSDDLEGKFFDCIPNEDLPDFIQECHRVLKPERIAYIMCDFETLKLLHTFAIAEGVFAPVGYGGRFESCKPLIWSHEEGGYQDALLSRIEHWLQEYSRIILDFPDDFGKRTFQQDALGLLDCIADYTDDIHEAVLIWDKVAAGMGYTYRASHEYIFMLWKGKKRKLNDLGIPDVLRFKKPWGKERVFPTQKPVELMELLIKQSTQPDELVFDPFMGSATTAIAAHNTGRRCITLEKSSRVFEIGLKRINDALDPKVEQAEFLVL